MRAVGLGPSERFHIGWEEKWTSVESPIWWWMNHSGMPFDPFLTVRTHTHTHKMQNDGLYVSVHPLFIFAPFLIFFFLLILWLLLASGKKIYIYKFTNKYDKPIENWFSVELNVCVCVLVSFFILVAVDAVRPKISAADGKFFVVAPSSRTTILLCLNYIKSSRKPKNQRTFLLISTTDSVVNEQERSTNFVDDTQNGAL